MSMTLFVKTRSFSDFTFHTLDNPGPYPTCFQSVLCMGHFTSFYFPVLLEFDKLLYPFTRVDLSFLIFLRCFGSFEPLPLVSGR